MLWLAPPLTRSNPGLYLCTAWHCCTASKPPVSLARNCRREVRAFCCIAATLHFLGRHSSSSAMMENVLDCIGWLCLALFQDICPSHLASRKAPGEQTPLPELPPGRLQSVSAAQSTGLERSDYTSTTGTQGEGQQLFYTAQTGHGSAQLGGKKRKTWRWRRSTGRARGCGSGCSDQGGWN